MKQTGLSGPNRFILVHKSTLIPTRQIYRVENELKSNFHRTEIKRAGVKQAN